MAGPSHPLPRSYRPPRDAGWEVSGPENPRPPERARWCLEDGLAQARAERSARNKAEPDHAADNAQTIAVNSAANVSRVTSGTMDHLERVTWR